MSPIAMCQAHEGQGWPSSELEHSTRSAQAQVCAKASSQCHQQHYFLQWLPSDVLARILKELPGPVIDTAASVCREWRDTVDVNQQLYSHRMLVEFSKLLGHDCQVKPKHAYRATALKAHVDELERMHARYQELLGIESELSDLLEQVDSVQLSLRCCCGVSSPASAGGDVLASVYAMGEDAQARLAAVHEEQQMVCAALQHTQEEVARLLCHATASACSS